VRNTCWEHLDEYCSYLVPETTMKLVDSCSWSQLSIKIQSNSHETTRLVDLGTVIRMQTTLVDNEHIIAWTDGHGTRARLFSVDSTGLIGNLDLHYITHSLDNITVQQSLNSQCDQINLGRSVLTKKLTKLQHKPSGTWNVWVVQGWRAERLDSLVFKGLLQRGQRSSKSTQLITK